MLGDCYSVINWCIKYLLKSLCLHIKRSKQTQARTLSHFLEEPKQIINCTKMVTCRFGRVSLLKSAKTAFYLLALQLIPESPLLFRPVAE